MAQRWERLHAAVCMRVYSIHAEHLCVSLLSINGVVSNCYDHISLLYYFIFILLISGK